MNCNFGTYLTRALGDQLAGGVRSQTTEKKLLSEDRTFDQALKIAQADELAERESGILQVSADTSSAKVHPVHAVHKKPTPRQGNSNKTAVKAKDDGKQSFSCGSSQHMADKCRHVKSICSYCKKNGHLANVCLKKKRESSCNTTHQVTATPAQEKIPGENEQDAQNRFTVYMRGVKSSGSPAATPPLYTLAVTIEDMEVPMAVDTGSSVTLLGSADFSKLGGKIDSLKPKMIHEPRLFLCLVVGQPTSDNMLQSSHNFLTNRMIHHVFP